MTLDEALAALGAGAVAGRAEGAAAYHKVPRVYLGIPNPAINDLTRNWRQSLSLPERVSLADALWQTNIFEARLAAAKLLTQARIRHDQLAWDLIRSWTPDFDSWAIADHAAMAGQRRLAAHPERLDEIEGWTRSPHMWTRRAALVITLGWTKQRHPDAADLRRRERILGWAAAYVSDRDWFIQKSVAWWLRDLSKRDPARVAQFLQDYGLQMKPFARKIAGKYLI
ncbi:MAG: DNA alkylation repair protein [Rhodobacteraceae bacterium]|nr:DNA alkylation repair protein [Paracoccaceae bacterium]